MARTFAPTVQLTASGTYQNTTDNLIANAAVSLPYSISFTSGTGVNQVDLLWDDNRSVASGTPDDIDLAGSLVDVFGNTLTFAKVKMIFVKNLSTTAGEILQVGGNASAQFTGWVGDSTDVVNVGPNGCFFLCNPSAAGYAVTATSGDILQIASASGTISYRISIWGISA